jgi:hypothetical protein
VKTTNVDRFSINCSGAFRRLVVDGVVVVPPHGTGGVYVQTDGNGGWRVGSNTCHTGTAFPSHFGGSVRAQSILNSSAPITIVIPDMDADPTRDLRPQDQQKQHHESSVALRIAHALHLYHQLDAEIVQSAEALRRLADPYCDFFPGNVLAIGTTSTMFPFVRTCLEKRKTPFTMDESSGELHLKGKRVFTEPGMGMYRLPVIVHACLGVSITRRCLVHAPTSTFRRYEHPEWPRDDDLPPGSRCGWTRESHAIVSNSNKHIGSRLGDYGEMGRSSWGRGCCWCWVSLS